MAKSNLDARLVFENARELAAQQGYNLNQAICTQSYIRSEIAMSTGTANYSVPILINAQAQNGQNQRVLENRLQLQDLFYVSELYIGWTVATAQDVDGKLYTYPNPTGAGSAAKALALNTLYNGRLSIQMNNRNVLPNWDINRHYYVPQTQQNTNFNVASPTAPAVYSIDELDLSENAFVPVEPGWVLNGAANIQANLLLPGAISTIPTNGAIVCIFRGILIQNSTAVK
jgi:hypothetical protein